MKMIWLSELNCHMYFYFLTFLGLYAFKLIMVEFLTLWEWWLIYDNLNLL
jgi:hypothetical protein